MIFLVFISGFLIVAGSALTLFTGALMHTGFVNVSEAVDDIEIVYCDNLSLTEVTPVCSYMPLMTVPFTANEIIEIRHPDVDGTIMIFEGASREDVFAHLSGAGHEQIPGMLEGYIELPHFAQEELGISKGDPSEFNWSLYWFEGDVMAGFLESDIELERTILYLPY